MGLKDLLKRILNSNSTTHRSFYPEYSQDDVIKIYLRENEKNILIDYESNEDIFILVSSTNLNISEDKDYLYTSYENLYELYYDENNKFSNDYTYLNLPSLYSGYIQIDNKGNFNESEVVKYTFGFKDGRDYDIERLKNNILIVNGEYQILPKDMYDFLKRLIEYNTNTEKNGKIEEQLSFLVPIKQYASKANIILNKRLEEEEEPIVIDKIKLDFKKEKDSLEILPVIEGKDHKFNSEFVRKFDESNEIKNFYNVLDNGKARKVVFKNRTAAEKVKRDRVLTGEKLNKFLRGESDLLNDEDNFDLSSYGPRVIGLGYLTYRANTSARAESDNSWFDTDEGIQFPILNANEDTVVLKPEHREVFQRKLNDLEENNLDLIEIEIKSNDEAHKIIMNKDEILNEIEKINEAIVDINQLKSITKLQEIKEKILHNPDDKFIEYKGKYVKNYGSENIDKIIERIREEKGSKSKSSKEKELLVKENLNSLEYTEEIKEEVKYPLEIPKSLKVSLFPHQKEGFYKLQNLYRTSKINGFLLADDMGLGKTLQILSLLAWIKEKEEVIPSLIVAPTTLIDNWDNSDVLNKGEIQKFFGDNSFTTFKIRGTIGDRELEKVKNTDITLISYESLRINHKLLGKVHWKVIICDEAQKIKNATTRVSVALKAQNADFKIACSATPIENTTLDLWNIMDFAIPGLLGSRRDFSSTYVSKINKLKSDELDTRKELNNDLVRKIENNFIRRSKEDALEGLPNKIVKVINIPANRVEKQFIEQIYKMSHSKSESVLPLVQRMVALCSHIHLVTKENIDSLFKPEEMDDVINSSSKLSSLKGILDEVKAKEEKVIIFTIFKKMQQILIAAVKHWYGINASVVNGEIQQDKRKDILDKFRKSQGFDVIVLSPEVAGVGITLTEANHVIHYTRLWNPAKEAQATDRAYRIGQKKDVYVYYPILTFGEYSKSTFNSEQEYINYYEMLSAKGKTPEEKLNRLLVRKKSMLNNFFLAAGESNVDVVNEWDEEESKDSRAITLYDVMNTLSPDEFEALCSLIYRKKGYRTFLTVKSGDKGVDVVVEKDNKYTLIQCKMLSTKNNMPRSALDEVYSGSNVYAAHLNIDIEKKAVISTAESISKDTQEFGIINNVEIILKNQIAQLLEEVEIYYSEIYLENGNRYSLEKLKLEV